MSAPDVVTTEAVEASATEVVALVNKTVALARAIVVNTPEEAQEATEFLAQVAAARKRNEDARLFIVGPLNKQIKAINAKFKENVVPLDEADKLVREKLLAFKQQEKRELAERQAREDAERRALEAAAEAERQRQAAEAARVEREAREAEERRQAQLRAAASERAREIAMLNDDELAALTHSDDKQDARLAREEVETRGAAREAQERADAARRRAEEATQASIAAASAPAVTVQPTQLASTSGSASTRKRWVATVVDESLVPRQYLVVDQKALNAAVKEGVREIAGVSIEQIDELAVRAGARS